MFRKEMKLELTGGVDGGRGWVGDAKEMFPDMGKIKSLGWKPKQFLQPFPCTS
jgi:UDP-glucose 4-epimerase